MKLVVVTQWVRAEFRSNPTRLKPSQQVGSEFHVQTQQWASEAGRIKDAGRVMEPRNFYGCGQQDIPQDVERGKADSLFALEGNSPSYVLASRWDPTEV